MSQGAHHGNTPAAWTLTILALVGSTVSGVAVVAASPVLFWVSLSWKSATRRKPRQNCSCATDKARMCCTGIR
jgi:hypothetical protein